MTTLTSSANERMNRPLESVDPQIADLLREDRTFKPPEAFIKNALVRDESIYAEAERDPEAFWARFAGELEWSRRWPAEEIWRARRR